MTELGETEIDERRGCATSVLFSVEVPNVAVMYTGESLLTSFDVIGKEAVVWPAEIMMLG